MKQNVPNRETVIEMINDIFAELFELPLGELTEEKQIFQDLGLDSLDIVDMMSALQKRFGILIRQDERFQKVRTLGDIYDLLEVLAQENCTATDNMFSEEA